MKGKFGISGKEAKAFIRALRKFLLGKRGSINSSKKEKYEKRYARHKP